MGGFVGSYAIMQSPLVLDLQELEVAVLLPLGNLFAYMPPVAALLCFLSVISNFFLLPQGLQAKESYF